MANPLRILGIEAGNKESAVALVEDGVVVAATCEERLSRERFDSALPLRALGHLLGQRGLSLDSIHAVTGNVSEARLREALKLPPRPSPATPWRKNGPESAGFHHLTHASFAFFTSGFDRALVVTVDGQGDNDTLVVYRGDADGLHRLAAIPHRPVSIGGVYEDATHLLGFGQGGEGKLMGLAPFAQPLPDWQEALLVYQDGAMHSPFLCEGQHPLRELARAPWAPVDFAKHAAFAASVQRALEDSVLQVIRDAQRETGLTRVCLGGGVALNCALNGRLAREPWLTDLWVPPSPADPGNAAGSALLWAWRGGRQPQGRLSTGGLGAPWPAAALQQALADHPSASFDALGHAASRRVAEQVAEDLQAGRVVGWFSGGSEYGPRALGHRSIVADPRSAAVRDRVNDLKQRERWRPLAPSIRAEDQADWIGSGLDSPFMLVAFEATQRMRECAPGVVHVDGTARAQSVRAAIQPAWHGVLSAFAAKTGVPLVLNTSFNLAGEPIVESPADALDVAWRMGLDAVYVEGVQVRFASSAVRAPRKLRPQLAVRGPVGPGWVQLLCQQDQVQVSAHEGNEAPRPAAVRALGLRAAEAPLPILETGDAAQRLRSLLGAGERPVFALGPLSARDVPDLATPVLPPTGHAAVLPLFLEGIAALRRNLIAQRFGVARQVTVEMPALPAQLADDAMLDSWFRRAWSQLSEGLVLADALADKPVHKVVWSGPIRAPVLHAWTSDGEADVVVRASGEGPGPAVRVLALHGELSLSASGQLELALLRGGQRHERRVGTARDSKGFFAAVLGVLAGGDWPVDSQRVVACGTLVDDAMGAWARSKMDAPGRATTQARAGLHADPAWVPPSPWTTRAGTPPLVHADMPMLHAWVPDDVRIAALVLAQAARPFAVAKGIRPVASFEGVRPDARRGIEQVAAALGLCVRVHGNYHHAAPALAPARDGAPVQCTVSIGKSEAVLDALVQAEEAFVASRGAATQALRQQLGALYGYPPCCVWAWLRFETWDLWSGFTLAFADATTRPGLPLVNPRPPGRLHEHFPCSLSCRATQALAEQTAHAVFAEPSELMRVLEAGRLVGGQAGGPSERALAALDRLLALPTVQQRVELATRLLRSPLLYVDPTRYLVWLDGQLTQLPDDGLYQRWQITGGTLLTSTALIETLPSPEEAPLHDQMLQQLAKPLFEAMLHGPIVYSAPRAGEEGLARLEGQNGWVVTGTRSQLRLQA